MSIPDDYRSAVERALRLPADDAYTRVPAAGGWSAAQCIEHLNVSNALYVDRIRTALSGAPLPSAAREAKHTLVGRLLLRAMTGKMKVKTVPAFRPGPPADRDAQLARFAALHDDLLALFERTAAIARDRIKVASPGSSLVKINLADAFAILAARDHRHLAQAERAAGSASI